MKKLASISLPIVISGLLSGCGGDILFNEPTSDMNSCVVGSWSNEGRLLPDTYAENYNFFADGTMQHDLRYEIPYSTGLILYLGGATNYIPRYLIVYQTGGWEYKDGVLYLAFQYEDDEMGRTESSTLQSLADSVPQGVPLRNSPYGTSIKGTNAHCDEQFFKTNVFKITSESPMTYLGQQVNASRDLEIYSIANSEYILKDNGKGISKYTKYAPVDEIDTESETPLEYYYDGNILNIDRITCDDCESSYDEYIDHGHTISRLRGEYFVRQ